MTHVAARATTPTASRRWRASTKRARVWQLLSELVRVLVSRDGRPREDLPPVWRDVQARTLQAHLKLSSGAGPAVESPEPVRDEENARRLERDLDWRPFFIARMRDDFAPGASQPAPE